MPAVQHTTTFVDPLTGDRFNTIELVTTEDDHGVPDSCRSCGKTAAALAMQSPPVKLMCCVRCKKSSGIRILYCSKACQTVDYKQGNPPTQPPHKLSCGKTHVQPQDESPGSASPKLDRNQTLKLYTKSPTAALQAQVEFLAANGSAHYGFRRKKNGKYVAHHLDGKGSAIFLRLRAEALGRRDLASIALMEKLLALSALMSDVYTPGDYVPQLEEEFEVDLEECHRALKRSARHQRVLDEWDGAPIGVLPWYHLPDGGFIHPVKYASRAWGHHDFRKTQK
ncbi:hypothetical protein FB451DRAFT_1173621 [Mycena latifolia]|nr:hypothetical protein FB451DRAFT_1173621 [Mycena latifolia]